MRKHPKKGGGPTPRLELNRRARAATGRRVICDGRDGRQEGTDHATYLLEKGQPVMRTQQRNLTAADALAGLAEEARNNNLVASIDWRTFKIKDAAGNPLEPEQAGAVVCTNATGPVLVTLDEHDDVASIMDFDEENVIYTDEVEAAEEG